MPVHIVSCKNSENNRMDQAIPAGEEKRRAVEWLNRYYVVRSCVKKNLDRNNMNWTRKTYRFEGVIKKGKMW